MATVPTYFMVGFFRTGHSSAESLGKVTYACHSFDKTAICCEDKMVVQRELVLQEFAGHPKRYPFRKLNFQTRALPSIAVDHIEQELSKYLFRTENGCQVKVAVGKKDKKYTVNIEVFPMESNVIPEKLLLSWGIYRSDSSAFIPIECQTPTSNGERAIYETAFMHNSFGNFAVEMEFGSYLAPFYLSFVLKYPIGDDPEGSKIKTHAHRNFSVPVGFGSGNPAPLGLCFFADGSINFALFSRNAEHVFLCLYDDNASEKPALEIELDPYVNRTGDIWHASIDGARPFVSYGYRCKGATSNGQGNRVLLDPYAKLIRKNFLGLPKLGELCDTPAFDWSGDICPGLPMEKLVVYRLNVMHFTGDKSSKLPAEICGTFSGVTEKIQHFKNLGINAILLEPVFPYNERQGPYFPFHFFSPVERYGPGGDSVYAITSMKEMVKKMHASGIEVYLEVVFTHTAEDGAFRDIDRFSYYYAAGNADLDARNALSCNYPIVQQLILDSLRYWLTEVHVDGFCFMNASYLLKGSYGEGLSRSPLIETIAFDPVLSKAKIIADCWDPCDLTSKEICFPHWKRWAEMNSKFSVDVKNFLKGEGLLSSLATRVCGSGDIFSAGRGPAFSFNFIARNFGLPLVDLVSFSNPSELSWNCGEEGPTNKKVVLERRLKQIRNFLLILIFSLGVPVLNMGDECGQSSGGSLANGDRKPMNWTALNTAFGAQITQFVSYLSALRERRSDLLQRREFLKAENIDWYGLDFSPPKWDDPSAKFLAMLLKVESQETQGSLESSHAGGDLYVAFNAGKQSENIILPSAPEEMAWVRLVDTALPFPGFFSLDGIPVPEQMPGLVAYEMKSYSCVVFEAKIKQS